MTGSHPAFAGPAPARQDKTAAPPKNGAARRGRKECDSHVYDCSTLSAKILCLFH